MAYLTINGVPFPVSVRGVRMVVEEVGDRFRALNGDMRSSVQSSLDKHMWPRVPLVPVPAADADTYLGILRADPPLTAAGDMIGGTISAHASDIEWESTRATDPADGVWKEFRYLSFTLHEQ